MPGQFFNTRTDSTFSRYPPGLYHISVLTLIRPFSGTRSDSTTYWLMVFVVNQSTKEKVNEVFQQAVSVGLVVCWTWVFNGDHWRAFRKSLSIYDEEVLKARDFVLSEARKYEIGFILSLSNN